MTATSKNPMKLFRLGALSLTIAIAVAVTAMTTTATHADPLRAWADRIQVQGDLRLRHEWDQRKNGPSDQSDTNKERLRLRLGLQAEVNDFTTAKIRLASSDGANAISTNSTLTDDGKKKEFYIDVAAIDIKLSENARLDLGKQDNNLRVLDASQLIYDADYTPEGAALTLNPDSPIFINLGVFSIQQRTSSSPDAGLLGAVVGLRSTGSNQADGALGYTVALGYHDFTHIKGNPELAPKGSLIPFRGNSNDGANYLNDYQVGEALAELRLKTGALSWSLYADAIQNFAVTRKNTGLLAGVAMNTFNDQGKKIWQFGYAYQSLAKDATLAAINYSDIADGYDASFGHILSAGRTIAANMSASLTYLTAKIDNNGQPFWMNTGMFDFTVQF